MGSQGTMEAVERDFSTCWLVHCQPGNVTCAVPWPGTHMTCWTSLQGGVSSGARKRLCPKALGAPGLGGAGRAAWEVRTVQLVPAPAGAAGCAVQCTHQGLN